MNRYVIAAAALALAAPGAAWAASPFDGTWKLDYGASQLPKKPIEVTLKDGVYACTSCVPVMRVKADGADHAVPGSPYFDTAALTVVGPREVREIDKKGGKVVSETTYTASPDGKTLTADFSDSSDSNGGAPVTGHGMATRIGAAPPGAHAISGSWRMAAAKGFSNNGLLVTFKMEGDALKMSQPTGQSYEAKVDGPEAVYKGDPGLTGVVLKRMGPRSIQETDLRNGKVVNVVDMIVSADGQTMTSKVSDKLRGTTATFKAMKQ